jgi:hypothetical protein
VSDDIERNLDTQSRRLDDIENLIRATLDDQQLAVSLEHDPDIKPMTNSRHSTTTFADDAIGPTSISTRH